MPQRSQRKAATIDLLRWVGELLCQVEPLREELARLTPEASLRYAYFLTVTLFLESLTAQIDRPYSVCW
jgi:hypothetical protein